MEDLQELDNCQVPAGVGPPPHMLSLITTPLRAEEWELRLRAHPDQAFKSYILKGIRDGFRLGFNRTSCCHPATRNLRSAYEHPEIIDAYLGNEVGLGRAIYFTKQAVPSLPELTFSPIGVIPKRNRPNKWRLIVDLSSPKGRSVNDGISSTLCSLTYASIDDAVGILRILGEGALMAKLDLRDAYRVVPVHPHDRPLLGMQWREGVFIDATLPFGLRSAPKIFSAVADGLMWMVHHQGFTHSLHYLDDFMLIGPPGSPYCEEALHATVQLCHELGVPVADEKTEGPSTTITFLGIEIDSCRRQLRLPQEKLRDLMRLLNHWMLHHRGPRHGSTPRRTGTKRDLLSLIGLLNHAATVVRPGRTFLRSLIDASTTVEHLDHHITLRAQARADIAWWYTFVSSWNGTSILPEVEPSHFLYSDASGTWGCGAFWGSFWFQIQWIESWRNVHIAAKELAPIVVAVALWGHLWRGRRICCYCDNVAVVFALNKGSARDPQLMCLLRALFFFSAVQGISLSARHIAGVLNESADALSRGNISMFFSINPQARPQPSLVPQELLELVFNRNLLWTSPTWTRLFAAILRAASLPPHSPPTSQLNAATQHSASKPQ